ncbi:hypothetical protein TWF694_002555 [Orbilia ellipsospora]|uniref:Uncharacterized protein n=1 Tax=Orbilia ellipsospora TaxID=2528407 RepID=A0AAV9X8F5_9PEZI
MPLETGRDLIMAAIKESFGGDAPHRRSRFLDRYKRIVSPEDRQFLNDMDRKISGPVRTASLIGLSVGLFLAFRQRRGVMRAYRALRQEHRATTITFSNGAVQTLADVSMAPKPSRLGGLFTYTLLGFGGWLTGSTVGMWRARGVKERIMAEHPEVYKRIRKAERRSIVEDCRKLADTLERLNAQQEEAEGGEGEQGAADNGDGVWPPPERPFSV